MFKMFNIRNSPINIIPEKQYSKSDATHNLLCVRHKKGMKKVNYYIPCIYMKDMPDGTVKVMAFNNIRLDKIYKIRYVHRSKLRKLMKCQ